MLQAIIQFFATFGSFLFSICIVAAAMAACLICTGIFTQQLGPKCLGAGEDASANFGMKAGATLGFLWSITAIYQLGNIAAIFSLLGLCVTILFFAWLTWFIGDLVRTSRSHEVD